MNRNKLKTFAPEARRDFIQAMTDRAAFFGLTAKKVEPVVVRGDVAVIAGRDHPRVVADKRKKLEGRIAKDGFEQTIEAMAYTWFNRFVAIRFMELHGYLDHGYRVLSHPEGKLTPEILERAEHVDLPGLKKDRVIDLKLDGNKESELYRLLLTAQCNALHKAIPFLFERIDDETELLLPDNLLHSNSLVRKLIKGIDEEDWKEVEIIGWLYQFYILERYEEIIGKAVASADIPAATQLFTPNWIVKYLVQNTLGRQWAAAYPNSAVCRQMEFYIEPATQTPEVTDKLKAITPASLDLEALTMLDPACGSCHILIEGYELFKAMYLERGYRRRDIPTLILQKNLFGLEIDDRAAQLGAFSLMMKARADDPQFFDREAKPNIVSFQETKGIDANGVANALNAPLLDNKSWSRNYLFEEIDETETPLLTRKTPPATTISGADIARLLALFENAKTFGSLIQIPADLVTKLPEIEKRLEAVHQHGDLVHGASHVLAPVLEQARYLARQYDVVVANPPYMKGTQMPSRLKAFTEEHFPLSKSNSFACFIERSLSFGAVNSCVALIILHGWLFTERYKHLRDKIVASATLLSVAHLGAHAFDTISGEVVQTAMSVLRPVAIRGFKTTFHRITDERNEKEKSEALIKRKGQFVVGVSEFEAIEGAPMAYWLPSESREAFGKFPPLRDFAEIRAGLQTGDNETFLRYWHEVAFDDVGLCIASRDAASASGRKWFPRNKGGGFKKWYGNADYVILWENDGQAIKARKRADLESGRITANNAQCWNQDYYFANGFSWSSLTTGSMSARDNGFGFLFDTKGQTVFPNKNEDRDLILSFLNSCISTHLLEALSPTLDFNGGTVAKLPVPPLNDSRSISVAVSELRQIAKDDWDGNETSWDYTCNPLVGLSEETVSAAWYQWQALCNRNFERTRLLEEQINRQFIRAYDLPNELSASLPDDQITLYRSDRVEDVKRLVSYAVGCVLGRYSLDHPGLVFAGSGDEEFSTSNYRIFPADDDGIIPVLGSDWGIKDDVTGRVLEFISVAWSKDQLKQNADFIAESLGRNIGEQASDTLRRYLASGFYKHHLSLYKRRPIYWMFSSGKLRAFQALIYVHRYSERTLARMRTEYVVPLQGQFIARIEQIEVEKVKASNTSHRRKLQKEQDEVKKQQAELLIFEEKLKHFADQRISLDLDDGVKVNYGKFGDLLADVKAITGGKGDE